ncbi:MAG: FKBP-type peptidyl-prolyl cis-trans isomerase [Puniceicoccales bacterium]|jgi:FKBP-type peptidyl-prolyl cis-trans isomerase|nr:FKBP-type peptidyl-prolyl cis-trans isomerase [Puniceicoccales bacterium]
MKESLRITLALAALATAPALAADKPAAAPAPAPAPEQAEKKPLAKEDRAKALNAIGWVLSKGQSIGVIERFGFSDADLVLLLEGFKRGSKGENDEIGEQFKEVTPLISQLLEESQKANEKKWEARVKALREKGAAEAAKYTKANKDYLAKIDKEGGFTATASGLRYKVLTPGTPSKPIPSSTVTVRYTGKLVDGTVFDSNASAQEPTSFRLDRVIPGWTEGMQKIGKGGKIHLVIPSEIAYRDEDRPESPIRPNSTLIFEVELIDFTNEPETKPEAK